MISSALFLLALLLGASALPENVKAMFDLARDIVYTGYT
jgi:hypothetical protein